MQLVCIAITLLACCCRHLAAKCKVLVKYNNTDGAVFLTSLRKLNSLVRSCNSLYVIKRPRLVLLYSKTQFCTRRQEGCSLLNEYSAKAPSSNQNCSLRSSFYKELLSQGGGGRGQTSLGHGSSLVPQKGLCFSSVSLNAWKGCLCVRYVRC